MISSVPVGAAPTAARSKLALTVLCAGMLMIQIDTMIVNVALPTVKAALGFSDALLPWVVDIYLLCFGGVLLLAGRLGDLYGHRRIFLLGLIVFTGASLGCGLAADPLMLVVMRAAQGLGGAAVTAMGMSLLVVLYPEPLMRARAMSVYGFVATCGSSIGLVLGGLLVHWLGWPSIFFINIPVGLGATMMAIKVLPALRGHDRTRLDVAGALSVTLGLMLAMYVASEAPRAGLGSARMLGLLAAALLLLATFLIVQARSAEPLMPLRLFRLRNFRLACGIIVSRSTGIFSWFVLMTMYLQSALNMNPLQIGLIFLPVPAINSLFALSLAARIVARFGARPPIMVGLLLQLVAYLWCARVPVDGHYLVDVLPATLMLGMGAGLVYTPLMLTAVDGIVPAEAGLASGIINTALMMGAAFGIALLTSLSDYHTRQLLAAGAQAIQAHNGGYRLAFLTSAFVVVLSMAFAILLKTKGKPTASSSMANPPVGEV